MKKSKFFKSLVLIMTIAVSISFAACTSKTNLSSTATANGNAAAGGNLPPNQTGGSTAEVTGTGAYTLSTGSASKTNETLAASNKDQSAVRNKITSNLFHWKYNCK